MKDSATDSTYPVTSDDKPQGVAANHPSAKPPPHSDGQELAHVRDILLGQFAAEQAEKLATLERALFDRLDQHTSRMDSRLDSLEKSMNNHRALAQESDELIREQLKQGITNANEELTRSQELVQAQLTAIKDQLSQNTMNKKKLSRMLTDIATKLADGTS